MMRSKRAEVLDFLLCACAPLNMAYPFSIPLFSSLFGCFFVDRFISFFHVLSAFSSTFFSFLSERDCQICYTRTDQSSQEGRACTPRRLCCWKVRYPEHDREAVVDAVCVRMLVLFFFGRPPPRFFFPVSSLFFTFFFRFLSKQRLLMLILLYICGGPAGRGTTATWVDWSPPSSAA